MLCVQKSPKTILVSVPWWNLLEASLQLHRLNYYLIFCIWFKELANDFSTELIKNNNILGDVAPLECGGSQYSRTLVTWTWKAKEKQFELAGSSIYQSKFQWNLDQGRATLVWISGEFEAMSCLSLSYWGPTVHIIFLCWFSNSFLFLLY